MCHLAREPSDTFVLMTTVTSLDSVVSHLGWEEEAKRWGSLGVEVGLCCMPGTVLGPQYTLSLDIPLWGYDYSRFVDEAQRGDEALPKVIQERHGESDSLYYDYSPKQHSVEGERPGQKVGVV